MDVSQFIEDIGKLGFWFNVSHWFVIVTTFAIGLLAYKRNPRNLNNKSLFFFNTSLSVWTLSMYASNFLFLPHGLLVLINRSTFTFAFLLTAAYMHFSLTFPEQNKERPWYYWAAVILSSILAVISLTTDLVHKNLVVNATKTAVISATDGDLFRYIVLAFAVLSFGATFILFSKLRRLKGRKKAQLQYVILGSLMFIIYIFGTDLIPAALDMDDLSVFGALGVLFFVFLTGYAIIKHRLLDVRLFVIKSSVYTLLVSSAIVSYVFFVYYLKKLYADSLSPDVGFIAVSAIVAFTFQPLSKRLIEKADALFGISRYDFESLLKRFTRNLSVSIDLDDLSGRLIAILTTELKVARSVFVLSDGFINRKDFSLSANNAKRLINYYNGERTLVSEELELDSSRKKLMQKLGLEVLVYFPDEKEQIFGLLGLSEKKSGDAYTNKDLRLLEIIASQVTIAVKNIRRQQGLVENLVKERKRIDQDAHDRIYNKLGALSKKAEAASLDGGVKGEARETLDILKTGISDSVTDLRRIVAGKELDESLDHNAIMKKELERICMDFSNQSSIKLDYDIGNGCCDGLKPQYSWHIQCIVEECLNNIRKHSKATKAGVSIKASNGTAFIQVTDNGIGMKDNNPRSGSQGLKGMRERAKKMDAKLSFSSNGKGTKVTLKVPVSLSGKG